MKILVHNAWLDRPEIIELKKKHTVEGIGYDADLILHPNAWRWSESQWQYLVKVIKEANKATKEEEGNDG